MKYKGLLSLVVLGLSVSIASCAPKCDGHVFKDEIYKTATIIEKGTIRHTCEKCGYHKDEAYYDLDEFAFEDKTFMYDGSERELLIEGMLPYGTTVKYENNKIKDIGGKEATANIYNEKNQLILSKTAKISIVENIGLPSIKVVTETGNDPDYKDKTNYTKMTASVENCDTKYLKSNISGGIRARGNSTNYDNISKRPWRLKFDSKQNLLGLNEGQKFKSWVLLADYFDQSMFRSVTAYSLGNSLFNYSNNYTSDYQHVNFYMNGDYRGVYLLCEQQQANLGRFSIAEPDEGETSERVGYLVEIDMRGSDDDLYFTTGPGTPTKGPISTSYRGGVNINGVTVSGRQYAVKSDTFSGEQENFIKKYITNAMNAFVDVLANNKLQILDENNNLITSPYKTQYETLNSFIDLESLFKTCIIHELMKNYDVGFGSFYLFVDFSQNSKHQRLTFGAPWDFDLSAGNKVSGNITKTNNEFIKSGFGEANFNPWLYLLSQTDFYDAMMAKYYSVFANSGILEKTFNFINYETKAFSSAFANDVERWKNGTGKDRMSTRQYRNHQSAVDYLVDWLTKRQEYMNGVYLK